MDFIGIAIRENRRALTRQAERERRERERDARALAYLLTVRCVRCVAGKHEKCHRMFTPAGCDCCQWVIIPGLA